MKKLTSAARPAAMLSPHANHGDAATFLVIEYDVVQQPAEIDHLTERPHVSSVFLGPEI
jgi:hypothetical protein